MRPGSILGTRDVVKTITDKLAPLQGDLKMLDFSTQNMYSDHLVKLVTWDGKPEYMPGIQNGQWDCVETTGRRFDLDKFEDFKTRLYRFQGWDPATGRPTRSTLESMGLKSAADELERQGLLGA